MLLLPLLLSLSTILVLSNPIFGGIDYCSPSHIICFDSPFFRLRGGNNPLISYSGEIDVNYLVTRKQVADILTKPLRLIRHEQFVAVMWLQS